MAMTEVEAYIRQQAMLRGMDPDRVVAVAKTEGGVKDPFRKAEYVKNGYREPSTGPFQMLVGGKGTGFPEGLGNKMIRDTGVDPRQDWKAGVNFALDTASKEGWRQWYGPKKAGYDNWYGIKASQPNPNAQMPAYTPVQNVQPTTVAQPTTNPQASVEGIASLPTVTQAMTDNVNTAANATAQMQTNPMGGIFNALLQSAMQPQAPQVPEEPMVRMADTRPPQEKVAMTSQTPNVYLDDLKRKYL